MFSVVLDDIPGIPFIKENLVFTIRLLIVLKTGEHCGENILLGEERMRLLLLYIEF
jgi:hypothetical protein